MKPFIFLMTLIFTGLVNASSEGIDPRALDNYLITGFSRPCCSFGMDYMGSKFGIAGVIDKDDLGEHRFARLDKQKDKVGMVYTCSAGFVDVSHLRDNADWSAHIYFKLSEWLGSGKEVLARREGGFKKRSVYFPVLTTHELQSLTEDDLEKLAISIGFSMALLHEIPTAFNFPVSAPAAILTNEKSSAFSVEDAYSNLLGNTLGARAARDPMPYNQAMEEILNETMAELEAQPLANTYAAYEMVRNDWWIKGLTSSFKNVLKRDFTFEGTVTPHRIAKTPFCAEVPAQELKIPSQLSNGRSVHDYYEIRGEMNNRMKRSVRKLGLKTSDTFTQHDYPVLIEAIQKDFIQELGERIVQP